MNRWVLEPQFKNKVFEIQYWNKGSTTISRKENFEHSKFICINDTRPAIDFNNPTGLEVTRGTDYSWSLLELTVRDGGPWSTWTFPDHLSQTDRDSITALVGIDLYHVLEAEGWAFDRSEYWFHGPLTIDIE
jgi:hypothetical protein